MALLDVKIPPLGESINSGVLAKWHVKDGDTVKKDQPLFELETDKITSEGVAESAYSRNGVPLWPWPRTR